MFKFQQAMRNKCKIKLGIQGPSGSGKTYSSLMLAYGLTQDWTKIAVIDTENGSSHLYSHLGAYQVLNLTAPYSPERYVEAIELAQQSGFECIILDSFSHEWNGSGGILDIHSNIPGNSFTAWAKVTPRHNACMQAILNCSMHVIATLRSKTDYVMNERNGKQVPEKVGLKATQRDDTDYEFTIVFELNHQHLAHVSKDRTGMFRNTHELKLTESTGNSIREWCEATSDTGHGSTMDLPVSFQATIDQCTSLQELIELYTTHEDKQATFRDAFINRKSQLLNQSKHLQNGHIA
jgi:hypothetical protein